MKAANPGKDTYVPAGTLPKPGWVGRAVRLVLGALLLQGAFTIGMGFEQLRDARGVPDSIILWVVAALLFLSMREVIDLGLGVSWGRKAQMVTVLLAGLTIALDFVFYGRLWAPPLGILFYVWALLIALPLGIALVLAGLLGTPGCEMRAYAELLARLRGRSASEHYCPGGFDFVDRREARLRSGRR
jgi:hypothetical protein